MVRAQVAKLTVSSVIHGTAEFGILLLLATIARPTKRLNERGIAHRAALADGAACRSEFFPL